MWNLKLSESEPVYRQIVKYIEERVRNGEFPPGIQLPTERKLAELLKVNPAL